MSGIDNIIEKILGDAGNEAEDILSRARHEAQGITDSFDTLAKDRYREITEKGAAEAAERGKRLTGVSELETRKMNLAARQDMLSLAFDTALSQLRALPEDEYIPFLVRLACQATLTGKEELILNERDRKAYGDKLVAAVNDKLKQDGKTAGIVLSESTRDMRGGLILKDGKTEANASFETIVRAMRDDLASQAAQILFH